MREDQIQQFLAQYLCDMVENHVGDDAPWHRRYDHEGILSSCLINCRQSALVEVASDSSEPLGALVASVPAAQHDWEALKADWQNGSFAQQRYPAAEDRSVLPEDSFEYRLAGVIQTAAQVKASQKRDELYGNGPERRADAEDIDDEYEGFIGEELAAILPSITRCMTADGMARTLFVDENHLRHTVSDHSDFDDGAGLEVLTKQLGQLAPSLVAAGP